MGALLSAAAENREVLRRCLVHKAQPLIGAALFHEYEDLFNRPEPLNASPLSREERYQLFEAFLSVCDWVRIYFLWRPNLSDEADNHLIELAMAGGADVIVTNNIRDLTGGELSFSEIQILTPAEFLKSYF